MFARRLIEHLEKQIDLVSAECMQKVKRSDTCAELLRRVPTDEQRQTMREIYRNLTEWLNNDPVKKQDFYISLGMRRAAQGVPFNELISVICGAREYFWDYVERETLLDAPADFWGGMKLLRSLDACFDNALYFTVIGYQKASAERQAAISAVAGRD